MKSINYMFEPHILFDTRIPYLFHEDIIVTDTKMSANWHRNTEFLCFIEGEGRVICDGEVYEVRKGDIFVANSNCMHAIHSDTKVIYHCLIIDADFCIENGIDVDRVNFNPVINDKDIFDKYITITEEIQTSGDFQNTAIRASLLNFLVGLTRGYIQSIDLHNPGVKKDNVENIKIATVYIKFHLSEKLSLDDIAAQSGLSKFHFSREFKRNVGMTTVNYINSLRCEKARKMLDSGSHKIHEVQEMCGFENASYFTRVFKKFCGVTPAEYHKSLFDNK